MRLFDPKFRDNRAHYVAQCILASIVMVLVLLVLDAIQNAAVIGALGASSFIAFTMPHAQVSRPRYLLGGYAVGILAGLVCHYLAVGAALTNLPFLEDSSHVLFASLAVGLAIFVMVITNLEHPPAAGVALGLVLNECDVLTIIVVTIGISLLTGIKTLLKPMLISLL